MLVFLVIILLALGYKVVDSTSTVQIEQSREAKTQEALAQAKAALIAWSVLRADASETNNHRPGTLPCPDLSDSMINAAGFEADACSVGGVNPTIGRLPWSALGTDDLRDSDGERLWYALSNNFRRPGLSNTPINSDTQSTLRLYASDGTTLLTPPGEELAAIIFSPGLPMSWQNRLNDPNNAANYLEAGNGQNNANANGPFIVGPAKDAQGNMIVNDRIITISVRELISAVEKRVLKEAQNKLADYATANNGKYPNPSKFNDQLCATPITNITSNNNSCTGDPNVCFGRLPPDLPGLANWFKQNDWARLLTYAVNKSNVVTSSALECSEVLNVNNVGKNYVLIAPGTAKNGLIRGSSTSLVDYLEDAENYDAWTIGAGQKSFVTPSASSNDQLRSAP